MADIIVQLTLNGTPVNGLANDPDITVLRIDTDAAVVSAVDMSDMGAGGLYKFEFGGFAEPGLTYTYFIDADPTASGQVDNRYFGGTFDYYAHDTWVDKGLNNNDPLTIFENTEGSDYDQTGSDGVRGPDVDKTIVKVGSTTTITRQP